MAAFSTRINEILSLEELHKSVCIKKMELVIKIVIFLKFLPAKRILI